MRGFIYCVRNKVNNKCYIGQTARTVEKRFKDHVDHSVSGKLKIHKAIRKYGLNNFEVITLLCLNADNEVLLRKKLNYVEKYFILKFKTKKNGYNLTDGGDGAIGIKWDNKHKLEQAKRCKNQWKTNRVKLKKGLKKAQLKAHEVHKKSVVQFDLNGNFIRKHSSIKEARCFLKTKANIEACCLKKDKHTTAGGYIWRYASEFPNGIPNKIELPKLYDWEKHYKQIGSKKAKKVQAYENGKLIKTFNSIREVRTELNMTRMVFNRYVKKNIPINGIIYKFI